MKEIESGLEPRMISRYLLYETKTHTGSRGKSSWLSFALFSLMSDGESLDASCKANLMTRKALDS